MKCSVAGIISLCVLYVAVALSVVSTILPLWSSTRFERSGENDDYMKIASFTAGVWGFCADAQIKSNKTTSKNNTLSFEHCYFYHTSTVYEVPKVGENTFNFVDDSVCNGYNHARDEGETKRIEYAERFANITEQDAVQFDRFLKRSCGVVGNLTLIFGFFGAICGVFAVIALTIGITCFRSKPRLFSTAMWISVAAFVCTTIAFAVWIAQIHPLKDAHLNGSFVLSVLAAMLYLNTVVLVGRHNIVSKI